MPSLLKPAAARLMVLLWSMWADRKPGDFELPKPGLVSFPIAGDLPHAYFYALGYRPSGERAVRIDMLERLAQQVRTARTGANSREGFDAGSQMMSLVGCSGDEFESILRSLGYRKHTVTRTKKAPSVENAAATETVDAALTEPAVAAPDAAPTPETAIETPVAEKPSIETTQALPDEATIVDVAPATAIVEASVDSEPTAQNQSASAPHTAAESVPVEGEPQTEEVTLWRMAPRRPPPKRADKRPAPAAPGDRKDVRPARGKFDGKNRDGRNPKKGGPKKGGAPHGERQGERRYSSQPPRRNKEPDPNSPFAVLAALKADMPTGGKPE